MKERFMETNITKVRKILFQKILKGYCPEYSYESAVDHWTNWFVLAEEEFNEICRSARKKLKMIIPLQSFH
jgi:alpha-L-arabinofuranosidase